MSARRVTTVTVPVQVRSGVAFEAYRDRTPLLTIWATRPALLVTLTLPERIEPGHVRFARQLATSAAAYATEVERRYLRGGTAQRQCPRCRGYGLVDDPPRPGWVPCPRCHGTGRIPKPAPPTARPQEERAVPAAAGSREVTA